MISFVSNPAQNNFKMIFSYLILSEHGIFLGDGELVVIHGSGNFFVGLGGLRLLILEESNDGNLGVLDESLGCIHIGNSHGGRAGLLLQPRNNGVRSPKDKAIANSIISASQFFLSVERVPNKGGKNIKS